MVLGPQRPTQSIAPEHRSGKRLGEGLSAQVRTRRTTGGPASCCPRRPGSNPANWRDCGVGPFGAIAFGRARIVQILSRRG